MSKTSKAIVFDIDGTLTPQISWVLLSEALGVPVAELDQLWQRVEQGKLEYAAGEQQLVRLWRRNGKATRAFIYAQAKEWPIHPAAFDLIPWVMAEGYKLALVTGAMDFYAETVARRLRIKHWYATTTFEWDEQDELKGVKERMPAHEVKLELLLEFCKEQQLDPEECIAVGDSENDLKIFERTGRGILVGDSSSELLKAAAWKQVKTLDEVKSVLSTDP